MKNAEAAISSPTRGVKHLRTGGGGLLLLGGSTPLHAMLILNIETIKLCVSSVELKDASGTSHTKTKPGNF